MFVTGFEKSRIVPQELKSKECTVPLKCANKATLGVSLLPATVSA